MKKRHLFITFMAIGFIFYSLLCSSCSEAGKNESTERNNTDIYIPADSEYKIVYFLTESRSQPVATFLKERAKQAKSLTCVNLMGTIRMNSDGKLAPITSEEQSDWNALLKASEKDGFKMLYCFHKNMNVMRPIFQDSAKMARFIQQLVTLQQNLGGDGMDFDIEYPMSDEDTRLLDRFFKNFRIAVGNQMIITADVGPKSYTRSSLGHLKGSVINKYLNWVNLMCYGAGRLNSIDFMKTTIQEYVDKNVNVHKIVVGLPFFAKAFYLNDSGKRVPFNPCYNYMVDKVPPGDLKTDTLLFKRKGADPDYLLFNSPNTIQKKAAIAKSYGGVMAWHWRCDVTNNHSLTSAIIRGKNK